MKKFYLETFGCKFNQADSELIKKVLINKGFKEVSEKESGFVVLNSCGVVKKTEIKIIKKAIQLKNKGKKVIITGCLPLIATKVCKKIADGILGTTNILYLPKIINKISRGKKIFFLKSLSLDKAKLRCFLIPKNTCTAIVPISEGCISKCSYCTTRLARGGLRSFEQKEILKNIISALESGAKEIQLTSQDLAIYGVDKGRWALPQLLMEISRIKKNFFVRLGMMNPFGAKKIFSQLLKIMENEKFYKFLHLPLQSGDDNVLKLMNRGYTTNDFLFLIERFQKKFKNSVLATDIIVGFPSENDHAFLNTINIVKKIKADILHLFRYSQRVGTEASKLKDFPDRIKKERSRILTKVWMEIINKKNRKFLGKKFKALITEKREKSFLARLPSYKAVILKEGEIGKIFEVQIKGVKPNYLIGEIVKN